MKRLLGVVGAVGTVVTLSFVIAATAAAAPAPKATGGYGYSYGGIQRHVSFAAIQSTTDTCGVFWNVTGTTTITIEYQGSHYTHGATLTQTGTSVTGSGGYPDTGPPYSVAWTTTGTVSADTINLTWTYTKGLTGSKELTGTIASDGSISGTWTDNVGGGTRTGTWTAPADTAHGGATYCGKGTFYYTDAHGAWYFGVVKAVSVSGSDAWFAVQILTGNAGLNGQWLAVRVIDNGEPGIGVDQTGGDVTSQAVAISDVGAHFTPAATATINDGNIQVH